MSDYSTPLGSIAVGQGDQVTKANGLLNATSPSALFGLKYATTTGLTFGYHGGHPTLSSGAIGTIADATLTLTASTINYVTAPKESGIPGVSTATTNWDDTANYWRIYSITANTTGITGYTDYREIGKMTGVGVGLVAPVTKTTAFTLAENENEVICNGSASITITLPTASACVGRKVWIKNIATFTIVSSSANVKPPDTDTAGTAILPATAGSSACLVSNGTHWVVMSLSGVSAGGSAITAKDEGSDLTTALTSLDFVGAGVTATNTGGAVTVTIPGSGAASVTIKDEGATLTTSISSMNFVGAGVTATNSGADVTVTITSGREILSANRNYYVRTDGSDSNNGLANTSGGAFLTIQKAINVISTDLDLGIYDVTVNVNDGTRTAAITLKRFLSGGGKVYLVGNAATPANCVISTTSASCFTADDYAGTYSLDGFKLVTATSGTSMSISGLSSSILFKNIDFGAAATAHISVTNGALCQASGNYAITGAAPWHYGAFSNGIITVSSRTVTITGTPAFSSAFCLAQTTGIVVANGNTYSGSATGSRYNISLNAIAITAGGGANYFPGGTAGTTATGGQYA